MTRVNNLPKLLILSSAEADKIVEINDDFIEKLNHNLLPKYQVEWRHYNDIKLEIINGKLGASVIETGESLANFKAVYFKAYIRYPEQAAFISEFLQANKITFVAKELSHYIPAHKLSQLARLARGGVRVPPTIYMANNYYLTHFDEIQAALGKKFIFKATDSSNGRYNYVIKNKSDLKDAIKADPEQQFIAQTFIENKSDLRVLVVQGDIKLVIERKRKDNSTHLNNTSKGATASLIPLRKFDKSLQSLALKAAKLMERDINGVDVMLEEGTKLPYVLEVNPSPQIASGAFVDEKLAIFVDYFRNLLR
jgi:glutathione synthase/RimK-type ligase-like ATP-grasp enzyme